MLTTLLDRLTGLTSKYFVLGAYVPVLVFGFLNGVVLYLEFDWFRDWAGPQISTTARVFDLVVTLAGLAVVAYVLWGLSAFLSQVLEGQHLPRDSWLATRLRRGQLERWHRLRAELQAAHNAVVRTTRAKPGWTDRLRKAATTGSTAFPGRNAYDGRTGDAAAILDTLRQDRGRAAPLKVDDLERAVDQFEAVLAGNDVTAQPKALSDHRLELLVLFDYAEDEWAALEVALGNRLEARFGSGAVAPTAFGNVGQSMQSYALSRYRLNLATFWSRLQPLVQAHKDFYAGLQDAKVQLDFLVSCVFLSAASTLLWLVVLAVLTDALVLSLAVLVVGMVLTRVFYLSATESYVAFAELVRSSVDLYRFELLDALQVRRPRSLRDERVLWEALEGISSGREWINLSYRPEERREDGTKEPQA